MFIFPWYITIYPHSFVVEKKATHFLGISVVISIYFFLMVGGKWVESNSKKIKKNSGRYEETGEEVLMVGSLIFNDMLIIQQNNTIIYIVNFFLFQVSREV